jgi:hypothetical protein
MIKTTQRKPIRTIIVYNIGTSFIDYVTTKYKNVSQKRNKISPIEDDNFISIRP